MNRMSVIEADITTLDVDVIVNAANESLLGGGGVDGAIHRAAGPELLRVCRGLRGCATGEARITKGFDLPADFVIHTVGPVWNGGQDDEEEMLAQCYRRALGLAAAHSLMSIAFPAISTGAYGFPPERATEIAVTTVAAFLKENRHPDRVQFCCFDADCADRYKSLISSA